MDLMLIQNNNLQLLDKELELNKLEQELKESELSKKIAALKTEIYQLQQAKEKQEQDFIKQMLQNGITDFTKDGYKVKITNTARDRVEVVDQSLVPNEFIRIKKEVDKTAIMKLYKDTGVLTEGTDIVKDDKWKITIKKAK